MSAMVFLPRSLLQHRCCLLLAASSIHLASQSSASPSPRLAGSPSCLRVFGGEASRLWWRQQRRTPRGSHSVEAVGGSGSDGRLPPTCRRRHATPQGKRPRLHGWESTSPPSCRKEWGKQWGIVRNAKVWTAHSWKCGLLEYIEIGRQSINFKTLYSKYDSMQDLHI